MNSHQHEAQQRAAFVAEAKTWLGTPFRDQADVKGGGIDCAMLLVRCAVDTGLVPPLDPRPYPPQWHLHRDEERFLAIVSKLGAEKPNPTGLPAEALAKAGDVIVYQVARCFAHGGIIIECPRASGEAMAQQGTHVLHAYYKTGHVAISPLHEAELAYLPNGRPRPFKLFDLWACGEARKINAEVAKDAQRTQCNFARDAGEKRHSSSAPTAHPPRPPH